MSTVKSKKLQVGTDATSSNNFTIYQPAVPDGTLRIGVGNADSPTEVGKFNSNGYVATNAPAFSAVISADQSVSSSTATKVQLDTEFFDTNSNYDNTTNYRFTPTVAGYYQVNVTLRTEGTNVSNRVVYIYKNGSNIRVAGVSRYTSNTSEQVNGSDLIYMNGTTDYIEMYGYISGTSPSFGRYDDYNGCSMSASLVRAV